MDTLVLNLQAGLNTFKAFERACFSITDHNLQKNCKKILKKYYLGSSFLEALQSVPESESNSDLQEVIENITLSLLLGASLTENLNQLSSHLKAKANTELEKLASEASVKMIFPLVFFIFPVIFILLGSASIEDFIISFNN
ncbi:type II secretion system F family protein [Fluviispira vulneris]|uniref:type II secretion system F family protein n=1 Tax=Fluviispira vulneris TaxID=2763012 RepID=UPI0025707E2E|nr:type II secretion system F family protein [Fluviispira vulneris]